MNVSQATLSSKCTFNFLSAAWIFPYPPPRLVSLSLPLNLKKKKNTPWGKKKSRYFLCVTHTQGMVMMSIYISSSPHLLLHNHTSVTMVGSTRCFERALQIGPGNLSLWPTLACFDLQRQLRAQPLFVDSSLAASTHCVAAAQVLWCTAGLFRPYMITLHHHHPPPPLI